MNSGQIRVFFAIVVLAGAAFLPGCRGGPIGQTVHHVGGLTLDGWAGPAFSPDGQLLYPNAGQVAFRADGKRIAFCAESKGEENTQLFVADSIDFANPQRVTRNTFEDFAPSWSPDGKRLVFARSILHRPYSMGGMKWDNWDVWTVNADGSDEKQLTHGLFYNLDAPHFSPDGSKVVFAADSHIDLSSTLEIIDLDLAGNVRAIRTMPKPVNPTRPNDEAIDSAPAFSPDGSQIVFLSDREVPYDYEIWITDPQFKSARQLTHLHSYTLCPVFSPDGKTILFASSPNRNSQIQLMRMNADGTELKRIR